MKQILYQFILRLRFQRLRSRFFTAFVVLTLPPMFVLGYISYNLAKDTLLSTNTEAAKAHLRVSSAAVDLIFKGILNLNQSIVLNDAIRDDLKELRNAHPAEQSDLHNQMIAQLQKMVNNQFSNFKFVDSIVLIDLNNAAHSLGRSDNVGVYEGPGKEAAIQQTVWYQRAVEANGKVVFFDSNVLGDSKNTFSSVKLFRDSSDINGDTIGILIVNLSNVIFDTVFTADKQSSGQYLALSQEDNSVQVIYPMTNKLGEYDIDGSKTEVYTQLEKKDYLVIDYQNETTGWIFLHIIPKHELLKNSRKISTYTTIMAMGIAVVALLLSYLISGSITRPLLRLKKMMLEWTQGRRDFGGESFGQDEVGAIGRTFKKITSENEELSQKLLHTQLREREAELRALQAQIKPHFLYNTLDSMYWLATIHKNHEVAQMALALSESFKLSLNKGKDSIPVYKELQHIQHYMTIQNIRYKNRFLYIEDVDDSIKSMEILKLLLQPLIENAIYHGLEPKIGKGTLSLTGRKSGDFLVFVVEDDGVGIRDMGKMQTGYGLQNVRERLNMYYGEKSGFLISSKPDEGTRIELRIYSPY